MIQNSHFIQLYTIPTASVEGHTMATHGFGKCEPITAERIAKMAVGLAGGGNTEEQTAKAMEINQQALAGEYVSLKGMVRVFKTEQ